MKFVDIHTHQVKNTANNIEILVKEFSTGERPLSSFDTLGIHPWEIDETTLLKVIPDLNHYLSNHKLWMLGEIGLDRVSKINFELQKEIFTKQVEFANKYFISRIVVHSVRAYSDILEILIQNKFRGKVLLHDYNSNIEAAEEFNKHFDTYYSFGAKLFQEKTQAFKVIGQLPRDKIFLETDDSVNLSIEDIYKQASKVLNTDQIDLKKQIHDNFIAFSDALFTDTRE